MQITDEMVEWFEFRTKRHIERVRKFCNVLATQDDLTRLTGSRGWKIQQLGATHDASKFREPEYTPYVLLTWKYHKPDVKLSRNNERMISKAVSHHMSYNPHHPEFHDEGFLSGEPNEMGENLVTATSMPYLHLLEMCADWCAMSEENKNSPHDWANKVIGTKYVFNGDQIEFIYDILDRLWG